MSKIKAHVLAVSTNKRWRVVARLRWFEVQHMEPLKFARFPVWVTKQRIQRSNPHRYAKASKDKLTDFTFNEGQSAVHALHRRIRENTVPLPPHIWSEP